MLRKFSIWLFFAAFSCFAGAAEPMRYVYPPPESGADVRMNYYWELLDAALKATSYKYGPYELGPGVKVMNAARAELSLQHSSDITIMARTSSIEREKTLIPVRIPLEKGLTGYRLMLIQRATQDKLNQVRTLKDFRAFSIGQGAMWVDTEILRSVGFTVVEGNNYESLFLMLRNGRFDVFSRGVNEIAKEWANGQLTNPDLAIEKNLLLYYPLPRYFFFSPTPDGELLAKRVEEGLRLMIKNGEFERRYLDFKREIFTGLKLSGRRLLTIANPFLSPETPLSERELWDSLSKELKPGS